MKTFAVKNKEVLTIVALVPVFGGLVYFGIRPLLGSIEAVRNEIQEELIKQEVRRVRLSELETIKQQYDKIQGDEEKKLDALLDRDQAVALIEKLEKIAQDTGNEITISIADTKQSTVQSQKNVKMTKEADSNSLVNSLPSSDFLKMTLSIKGNYNSLFKFVSVLESLDYYADILVVNVKRAEENKEGQTSLSTGSSAGNPFRVGSSSNLIKTRSNGEIEASLETIFYTKK